MIVANELKDALLEVESRAREAVDLMDEVTDWVRDFNDNFDDDMDEQVAAQAEAAYDAAFWLVVAVRRWRSRLNEPAPAPAPAPASP
jgi:hypothetical protein